ncbi:MAG: lipocalin family protein [Pseudomonadota bacterium]
MIGRLSIICGELGAEGLARVGILFQRVEWRRRWLLAAMCLGAAACVPFSATGPWVPDFEEDRFLGSWRVRFASDPSAAPYWLSIGILTSDYSFAVRQVFTDCRPGDGGCDPRAGQSLAGRATAPGVYRLGSTTEAVDFAVVWVDPGYRTAAVAAPDGSYVWLLDRDAKGHSTRLIQARAALKAAGFGAIDLEEKP